MIVRRAVIGIIAFLFGCALLFSSFSGITGFAVFNGVNQTIGGVLGAVLVIGGLSLVLFADR